MDKTPHTTLSEEKNSLLTCQTSQGLEIKGTLLRLSRHVAAFEVYTPSLVLHMSEVLSDFKIVIDDRPVFSGRAVVCGLVNTGTVLICEVTLDESWLDFTFASPDKMKLRLQTGFGDFLQHWQRNYKVLPEFKVVRSEERRV